MKKAKLKINYHNQYGDWNKGTILVYDNNTNNYITELLILNKDFVENNLDIFEILIFDEKTAEKLALEAGFKKGDKCWIGTEYWDEIEGFGYLGNKPCIFGKTKGKLYLYQPYLTNKVAVHTKFEEDFEFIYNHFKFKLFPHPRKIGYEYYLKDDVIYMDYSEIAKIQQFILKIL